MRPMATHAHNALTSSGSVILQHDHSREDLHDLNSAMNPSAPSASVPQMYYPPYPAQTLSMPTMNYQYPEGSMDLTYMFAAASANASLPFLEEPHQARLGSMQDRHPSDMSCTSATAPSTQLTPPRLHQSSMQNTAHSSKITSFPTASTSVHTHTILPPMIHPDLNDQTLNFGADSRTLTRVDSGVCAEANPYAAAFIRERLGDNKWNVFSARLFERRLGMPKSGSRNKTKEVSGSAGAIDFMVKVEVVKEVLRTYVPHPYNPLKSLKHEYAASPTGGVTLTRSIVLALAGWSNTQFSYWARRVEAVSVLTPHDERLRNLGSVLQQRLKDDIGAEFISTHSDRSEEERSETPNSTSASASGHSSCFHQDFDQVQGMTGKGLDVIIDEAKKRTGASQFLRGKHSSLDPFGAIYIEDENGAEVSGPVFMPTFQAVEYGRSMPSSNVGQPEKRRGKGKIKQKTAASRHEPRATVEVCSAVPHLSFTVSGSRGVSAPPMLASQKFTPSVFVAESTNPDVVSRSCTVAVTSTQQNTQIRSRNQQHVSREVERPNRRELFPVSDSRSELENMPQLYKRGGEVLESVPKKRTRQSDLLR